MLQHNYFQDTVGYQRPIKNDQDSQALPSDDDWENAINPKMYSQTGNQNMQQGNYINGIIQPQYQSSYQQQQQQQSRGFQNNNENNERNHSQRVVNDPFPSVDEQFNPQYKPTSNRQGDSYQNYQQQIYAPTGMTIPSRNQINTNTSQKEINDSPTKLNNLKKSTLVIQQERIHNQNNNIMYSQQGQFNNNNNGINAPYDQESSSNYIQQQQQLNNQNQGSNYNYNNYDNPLGINSMQNGINTIQNGRNPQQSLTQTQAQQQYKSKIDSINEQKSHLNTTIMDNYYNDVSPHKDINLTTQGFNNVNNTYADQPLVTPSKQKTDLADLINKTDLNITNNNNNNNFMQLNNSNNNINNINANSIYNNNNIQSKINNPNTNMNNISSIHNNSSVGLQKQLEMNQAYNQPNRRSQNDGMPNNQLIQGDDRNNTVFLQRETYNDGQMSYQKQSVNNGRNNYSGMYTYQIENVNNRNQVLNTASAHLAFESQSKKLQQQQLDQDGKIVNVDDPYFLENYDPQNLNLTQFNTKKFSPLEISYLKKAQKILNTDFFYNKLPITYFSFIVPEYKKPFYKFFALEYIIPLITVFLLHVFLWGVQKGTNDYCFESSSLCKCSSFSIRLWTFFRQLVAWKLGVISCKNILMIEVGEERHPLMESFLMYIVGIGIDFVMVVGVGMNEDWQFYIMIFFVGYILTVHTIKFKQFSQVSVRGKGLYMFDLNLVVILVFIYYALPAIYQSLIQRLEFSNGRTTFLYLYPLLEWVFELFTNFILERASLGEFFQYQMYLLILGMKVGIMTSVSSSTFEFWYLGTLFFLKRIFESTNIIYINIRKLIYRMFPPNLKYFISMGELPDYRKGREGYFLENIIWLGMYYWWFYTETIVPGYVKQYIVVDDCEFSAKTIFKNITWDRPFFAWIFLFAATITSLIINSNLRLDMIKWVGSPKHNFFENVFTRMFGWYLFQIALTVSYSISRDDNQTYSNF